MNKVKVEVVGSRMIFDIDDIMDNLYYCHIHASSTHIYVSYTFREIPYVHSENFPLPADTVAKFVTEENDKLIIHLDSVGYKLLANFVV